MNYTDHYTAFSIANMIHPRKYNTDDSSITNYFSNPNTFDLFEQKFQDYHQIQRGNITEERDHSKIGIDRFLQSKQKSQFNLQPSFSKIKLLNSNSNTDIHCLLNKFNNLICSSLDKVEQINIDEFKNNINVIFETITNYNQDITSWYDEDFKTDISKLLNSITTSNEKYKSFKQSDFIQI